MLSVTLAVLVACGVISEEQAIKISKKLGNKKTPDTIEEMIEEIKSIL